MKVRCVGCRAAGFTWVELLVVIATVLLVGFYLFPRWAGRRHHGHAHSRCVSNLKQVGLAFRMFSNDHEDKFPWAVLKEKGGSMEYANSLEVFRHFLVMSNELSNPRVLACPMDTQRPRANDWQNLSNSNLSYFVGLDAEENKPNSILAGDRSLALSGTNAVGVVQIQKNSNPQVSGSFHNGRIHIGLADGSAQQMGAEKARSWILYTNSLPLRVAIP